MDLMDSQMEFSDKVTIAFAAAAFVIALLTIILSIVNTTVAAQEGRIQLLLNKLLEIDFHENGQPSPEVLALLHGKTVRVEGYLPKNRLIEAIRKLERKKRLFTIIFLATELIIFSSLAAFWFHSLGV
ncbi:hypothetical protein [Vreelandella neptunia]|uniref:Uncharacterized protein n=1 Tax=Vreelandella neptunia TaxID=115551 RepID=A0ABZ0YR76_9GAMM|nr:MULTISPECIES: hypothetical protein [Halomonas]MBF60028.1 hypothetical protein [Halomonas sp.]MDN3559148.1 hypothetical protein [Halomonas neptunia]WQH14109.1 hypothetical protein SR894_06100 [Halomonas neptunia]|tara:strand:+ start:9312 stop:9695 length:384 start_codon:yes stop_codon:yes gene_type:complete